MYARRGMQPCLVGLRQGQTMTSNTDTSRSGFIHSFPDPFVFDLEIYIQKSPGINPDIFINQTGESVGAWFSSAKRDPFLDMSLSKK